MSKETEGRAVSDRFDRMEAKLARILNVLERENTTRFEGRGMIDPIAEPESNIIEVKGIDAPWVTEGVKWDGYHEVRDQAPLTEFLGFNPNGADGGLSWCAGFWISVFKAVHIDTAGLDLSARSFVNWGWECKEVNGAILVFGPKDDAPFPVSHVGVKLGDELFGGNQGNSAKCSNLAWYKENAELLAVRCPEGYNLI